MKRVYKFIFLNRRMDSNFLYLFRILIGFFVLVHFVSIIADFDNLYSRNGVIDQHFMSLFKPTFIPAFSSIASLTEKYIGLKEQAVILGFITAYIILSLCLITGFLTRVSSILLLLAHLILAQGTVVFSYGVDVFTTISLFYCCVFPVAHNVSLDKKIFNLKDVNPSPYRKILQLHLTIVYFASGFEKLVGDVWRNGEAIWQVLNLLRPSFSQNFNYSFFANNPTLLVFSGWAVVVVELLYPVFIWNPKLKNLWLTLTCLLHLGIAFFMGLYYFASIMILLNLLAFLDLRGKNWLLLSK
jgi:hypothetical protein